MPIHFYTEREFLAEQEKAAKAEQRLADLKEQLELEIELAAVWRQQEDMQSSVGALHGIWSLLGVEHQTAAIQEIKLLQTINKNRSALCVHKKTKTPC